MFLDVVMANRLGTWRILFSLSSLKTYLPQRIDIFSGLRTKKTRESERGTSSLTQQAMKGTLLARTLAAHNGIILEDKTTRRSTLFTEAHRKSVCFYWLPSFLDKFDLFCRRDLTRFQRRKQRESTSLSTMPMKNVPVN